MKNYTDTMTSEIRRKTYLVVAGMLSEVDAKISKLVIEQSLLEKRAAELQTVRDALRHDVCQPCLGVGHIWISYAQDETRFEKCSLCHGTGLPRE